MKSNSTWQIRLMQILLGVAIVIALVWVRGTNAGNEPIHLTTDWSHRHVVFSAPQNLGQHVRLLSSPRYVQQLVRRNSRDQGDPNAWRWQRAPEPKGTALHGDWSMYMGPGATVGADNYPAKYSFDPTTAYCANVAAPNQPDFVVYNTSLPGATTAVAAHQSVTFAGFFQTPSGTVIVTNGANTLTLTASTINNTGNNFLVISSGSGAGNTTNASSLAAKIVSLGGTVGVTATSAAGVVTITATTAGSAGNSITLTGTMGGANGVTFGGGTFTGGADPQATIGAFDNLYSSCTGTVPSTYWAYNTGTAGAIVTSPILSGGGDQVAVVQNTATASTLVLIKWKASDGTFTAPTTLTNSTTAANYHTCVTTTTGPCMFTIAFNVTTTSCTTAATDTNSSPFYDFANDVIYVGNDQGCIHKFTGVFKGAPAEVVSNTGANRWPALVNAGNVLTSSVFDDGTGRIFVGDNIGTLYRVDSTIGGGAGGVVASAALETTGAGFDDSPVLDPSLGNVYVFLRSSGGGAARARVYRFTTGFAAASGGSENQAVSSSTTVPVTGLYAGTFDNIYYSSGPGTGSMYVCGTNAGLPAIWRIPITAGVLGTPVAGPTLTTANVACAPITEFYDGTTDRMFLSVTNNAVTNGVVNCPAATGCVMSYDITTTTGWGTTKATSATASAAGGTSAIIVDNASSAGGASQVYFTPLASQACTTSGGTGGCAIQASQSGLN